MERGQDTAQVLDHERVQSKISRLTRTGSEDFVHRRVSDRPFTGSIHATAQYSDRGVEFREDYSEMPKIGNMPPFRAAVPRGNMFADYEDPRRYLALQGGG